MINTYVKVRKATGGHKRTVSDSVIVSKSCHPTFLVSTERNGVFKHKSAKLLAKIQCAVDVHQIELGEENPVDVNLKAKSVEEYEPKVAESGLVEVCDFPVSEISPFPSKAYSRIVTFSTVENVFSPYLKPP